MVFSSFLSACVANINIKTTVCTIFSLPATKIQYHPTAAGNRVTERLRADRQNPGRETAEEAGRPRRSPVVGRAGERRRTEPGTRSGKGSPDDRKPDNARRAGNDRTGFTDPPHEAERTKRRTTGQAGRETRAERDERPGRSGTRNPGGVEQETRAEWNERPERSGTRDPGGHKKTDRNLQIAVRRFGSGSLTSRFSYRSALRNGS